MKNTLLFLGLFYFALANLVSCKSKETKSGYVAESALTSNSNSNSNSSSSGAGVSGNWSSYQGRMKWDDAVETCKELRMRLPTIDDLKLAYASGVTKSWQKDTLYYWSSSPNGANIFYNLNVDNGDVGGYPRDFSNNVRCLR